MASAATEWLKGGSELGSEEQEELGTNRADETSRFGSDAVVVRSDELEGLQLQKPGRQRPRDRSR